MYVGYISVDRVIDWTSLRTFEDYEENKRIISYFFPPEFDRDSSSVANSRVTSVLTVHPDSQLTASSGCLNININVQIYYRKIKHLLLHGGEFCCFRSIKNISSLMSVRVKVIIKVLRWLL